MIFHVTRTKQNRRIHSVCLRYHCRHISPLISRYRIRIQQQWLSYSLLREFDKWIAMPLHAIKNLHVHQKEQIPRSIVLPRHWANHVDCQLHTCQRLKMFFPSRVWNRHSRIPRRRQHPYPIARHRQVSSSIGRCYQQQHHRPTWSWQYERDRIFRDIVSGSCKTPLMYYQVKPWWCVLNSFVHKVVTLIPLLRRNLANTPTAMSYQSGTIYRTWRSVMHSWPYFPWVVPIRKKPRVQRMLQTYESSYFHQHLLHWTTRIQPILYWMHKGMIGILPWSPIVSVWLVQLRHQMKWAMSRRQIHHQSKWIVQSVKVLSYLRWCLPSRTWSGKAIPPWCSIRLRLRIPSWSICKCFHAGKKNAVRTMCMSPDDTKQNLRPILETYPTAPSPYFARNVIKKPKPNSSMTIMSRNITYSEDEKNTSSDILVQVRNSINSTACMDPSNVVNNFCDAAAAAVWCSPFVGNTTNGVASDAILVRFISISNCNQNLSVNPINHHMRRWSSTTDFVARILKFQLPIHSPEVAKLLRSIGT